MSNIMKYLNMKYMIILLVILFIVSLLVFLINKRKGIKLVFIPTLIISILFIIFAFLLPIIVEYVTFDNTVMIVLKSIMNNVKNTLLIVNSILFVISVIILFIFRRKSAIIHLDDKWYKLINNGVKTLELRLYDEKRRKLHIGDRLIFVNRLNNKRLTTKIVNMYIFESFDELFKDRDLSLKSVANINDLRKFYSSEDEKKYGVVGIEIKVIGE